MPIDCVWIEEPPDRPGVPGECFWTGHRPPFLSKHYHDHVEQHRKPIVVMLPTRTGGAVEFHIDSHPSDEPNEAWEVLVQSELVVGAKPLLTVRPSINCVGLWHGHLVDGTLSDDLGD